MLISDDLKQRINTNPHSVRDIFKAYDTQKIDLSDEILDDFLGLDIATVESGVNQRTISRRYGPEQFTYEGTPYDFTRIFLEVVDPSETDVVYDLGAGYGRVLLYGALTRQSLFRGIEIVPERVGMIQKAIDRFSISNAQISRQNVLDSDFSDGTIFFLFNPFGNATITEVLKRLHDLAKKRSITIVAWGGGGVAQFSELRWLKEIVFTDQSGTIGHYRLKLFQSTQNILRL